MTNAEIEKKLMELEGTLVGQKSAISSLKSDVNYEIRDLELALDRHIRDEEAAKGRWFSIGTTLFGLAITGLATWAVVSVDTGYVVFVVVGNVILALGIHSLMG